MEPDDTHADAPMGGPEPELALEPAPTPSGWWASSRIRLALLLTGLTAASLALVSVRGGLLDFGGGPPQASGAAFPRGCPGRDATEVASIPVHDLAALRNELARIMPPRVGRVYEMGTVRTSDLWSDDHPQPLPSSPATSVPAGYEIRWWALDRGGNEDDVVADVFEFATNRQAQDVLARAASTRCRSSGDAHAARRPSGARNLSWVNPDNAEQWDVLFVRGRRLYRIGDVPASYPPSRGPKQQRLKQLAAEATGDMLACALPDAACPPSADWAGVGSLATLRVSSSAMPRSAGPVTRGQVSAYARAVNLRGYDVPEMTPVTQEVTTKHLGYWDAFVRCTDAPSSTHPLVAIRSPTFRYRDRLEGGHVYSIVAVFASAANADTYLAALATARARACGISSDDRQLRPGRAQRHGVRFGRIAGEPLPAPAPTSYRGLGPYRGTGLRLTIPLTITTTRGGSVQLHAYLDGFVFAYGRALIGLADERDFRPFSRADEQYLMSKLVGRAEASEAADLLGPGPADRHSVSAAGNPTLSMRAARRRAR